jgi:hypothetical protein
MAVTGAAKGEPSAQVLRSIAAASQQTGVSFGYLLNQAKTESRFNPAAKAPTSSASGLFQFTKATWLATLNAHGAEHGLGWAADEIERSSNGTYNVADPQARQAILDLRNDPDAAAAMAAELAADNSNFLAQKLGHEPTTTDLALSHFLGAQGAAKFLAAFGADPDASAAPLFPEAAAANRSVFYDQAGAPRSLADIHARFGATANDRAAATVPATVSWTTQQQVNIRAQSQSWSDQPPSIEPMPDRLSLTFAQDAYRRLAAMGRGA